MESRLNIAFLWHMHQPVYKDPFTKNYEMPWVLLHGTKDYYDMVAILDRYPNIHQTFNIVPSLIEQLNDYAGANFKDHFVGLTQKPAFRLGFEEKRFLLEKFFQANWHTMIAPYPRYFDLLRKRVFSASSTDIDAAVRFFTTQDYLDLQVLFNLAWIDPWIVSSDETLNALKEKGRNYTEEDKKILHEKQLFIIRGILPKYREVMERGQIELTTSPYFHPILPLLCDNHSAMEAVPGIMLPKERLQYPEDALAQLKSAVALHKKTFGREPQGLWPSEGSVSMDMLGLLKEVGIRWTASDEEVLSNTLSMAIQRDNLGNARSPGLYRPYYIEDSGQRISMIFRDHALSDLIGFVYSRWGPEQAAHDFIKRLEHIRNLTDKPEDHLVSIILDGENAWEHYANDGRDFLSALYANLSVSERLKCVTITEFLSKNPAAERLNRVFAGSWINSNFKIWVGHVEDNTAWDFIAEARSRLVLAKERLDSETLAEAWTTLYAAEGSDWFWWYGDDHSSENDAVFDSLFRRYIKKIYALIGEDAPARLEVPIISRERGLRPNIRPTGFIEPVIDGEVTNYFEWLMAGRIEFLGKGAAMHAETHWSGLIDSITYGYSLDTLFMRFDYLAELRPYNKKWSFTINILHPKHIKIEAAIEGNDSRAHILEKVSDREASAVDKSLGKVASGDVVELALSFEDIGANLGDELWIFIQIDAGERGSQRWPHKGFLILDLPTEEFGKDDWTV
ncbi:MAG: glycoside hydrolase [Deltaproteobacteria bacterium]|nr:glycoside hydrolase [Deltaproteobacteria bacterium]